MDTLSSAAGSSVNLRVFAGGVVALLSAAAAVAFIER